MASATLHFHIVRQNDGWRVQFASHGGISAEAGFPFDCRENSQVFEPLDGIGRNACNYDDLY
jgi:hypothetical protein